MDIFTPIFFFIRIEESYWRCCLSLYIGRYHMKQGFTLIELLVVVLIIGILSSVAMPQYTKAVKKARFTEVVSTMKSLEKALNLYVLANPGTNLSYGETLDVLDLEFPNRNGIYIGVGKSGVNQFRIYTQLSSSSSNNGWWIHVDSDEYGGGIMRWEGDGDRTCKKTGDFAWLCTYLESQGLADNSK